MDEINIEQLHILFALLTMHLNLLKKSPHQLTQHIDSMRMLAGRGSELTKISISPEEQNIRLTLNIEPHLIEEMSLKEDGRYHFVLRLASTGTPLSTQEKI